MYYVFDINGDGYATVSESLPKEYETYIGEYSSKEEAVDEAAEYEDYIQNEIDKSQEWFYEEDDEFYDDDEE